MSYYTCTEQSSSKDHSIPLYTDFCLLSRAFEFVDLLLFTQPLNRQYLAEGLAMNGWMDGDCPFVRRAIGLTSQCSEKFPLDRQPTSPTSLCSE